MDGLLAESQLLAELNHPNILRMYGMVLDNDGRAVGILTEFCKLGSLGQYLHSGQHPRLPLRQRVEVALQIARGLAYLHDRPGKSLVHFDLKPDNLLLVQGSGNSIEVKVSDFGLSKHKLYTYVESALLHQHALPDVM